VRSRIRTGVSDGKWIEVTNLKREPAFNVDYPWTPVNGLEQVIRGDPSVLSEAQGLDPFKHPLIRPAATAGEDEFANSFALVALLRSVSCGNDQ
jgi:hypothetical protein